MRKTVSSRRISSAMASRNASRTVSVTVGPVHSFSCGAGARFGAAAAFAAGCGGFASATCSTGASCAGVDGLGAGPPEAAFGASAFSSAATSSPSPAMSAIGRLTATFSLPSGTRILAKVPSSAASISIVALSVSISARMSPALTVSPGFLCHLAILPSVMVGESAGISTSIGMWRAPSGVGVDVGPQLRGIGLGTLLREIGGGGDDVFYFLVDILELRLVRHAAIDEPLLHLIDGIVLLAHAAHFVLAAVFRRIGHGVAAIAIGQHLENVRAFAGAGVVERLLRRLHHRNDIHAVHLVAGNVERRAAAHEIMRGGAAGNRCPYAVFVVLDDVDDRQLPKRGHVEALVHLALVHRAVAEEGDADLAVLAISVRKAQAGADRHLCANDAVPAEEFLLAREHVHRAAFALGVAATATRELGHDALGIHAGRQHVAVIAVRRDDAVALFCGGHDADDDRLLTDIEMAEAADEAHAVHLPRLFLEAADEQHVAVILQKLRRRYLGLFELRGSRPALRQCHGTAPWIERGRGRATKRRGQPDASLLTCDRSRKKARRRPVNYCFAMQNET